MACHSLKRYDPCRGALPPFLYRCTTRAAGDAARRLLRERTRHGRPIEDDHAERLADTGSLDPVADERIAQLAADFLGDPTRHGFTARQAQVFKAIQERGDKTMKQVAGELGYADDSNLYHMIALIREGIRCYTSRTMRTAFDPLAPNPSDAPATAPGPTPPTQTKP